MPCSAPRWNRRDQSDRRKDETAGGAEAGAADARRFRAFARCRRRRLPPLRLRPILDRQPLAARSSGRATRRSARRNRSAFRTGKKSGGALTLARRGRACADAPACRAGDHRAGQPLLRLCRGRAAVVSARHRQAARRTPKPVAAAAAGARRARRFPARGGRSRSFAPASKALRAASPAAKQRPW